MSVIFIVTHTATNTLVLARYPVVVPAVVVLVIVVVMYTHVHL